MAPTRAPLLPMARAAILVASLGALALPVTAQTTTTKPAPGTGTTPAPATTTAKPTKPAPTAKPAASGTAAKPATAGTTVKPATSGTTAKPAASTTTSKPAGTKSATTTTSKPPSPKPVAAAPAQKPAGTAPPAAPVAPPPAAPLPPTQTTPLRDAGPAPAAAPAAAANGPAFLDRHPVIGGFVAGLLGHSVASMLFGDEPDADGAARAPRDANVLEPVSQTSHGAETVGQVTRLALFGGLVYLGVAAWRRRAGEASAPGGALRERAAPSVSDWDEASDGVGPSFDGLGHPDALKDIADEQDFADILVAVQSAWTEGNIALIRAHVTPEMADHYNDALAQNTRNGIESRVEQVEDVRVERLRDWEEDGLQFAAARMRWKALDYLIDAAKTADEPGYVVDGSRDEPVDCEETWTFVKVPDGAWVLTDVEATA